MADQDAVQDSNQIFALIGHSGTSINAETRKVVVDSGALRIRIYAEDINDPGVLKAITGAYDNTGNFVLLTGVRTVGTSALPVSLQYMGMFGPYTYPT